VITVMSIITAVNISRHATIYSIFVEIIN